MICFESELLLGLETSFSSPQVLQQDFSLALSRHTAGPDCTMSYTHVFSASPKGQSEEHHHLLPLKCEIDPCDEASFELKVTGVYGGDAKKMFHLDC